VEIDAALKHFTMVRCENDDRIFEGSRPFQFDHQAFEFKINEGEVFIILPPEIFSVFPTLIFLAQWMAGFVQRLVSISQDKVDEIGPGSVGLMRREQMIIA
jgi:hypothetical protein